MPLLTVLAVAFLVVTAGLYLQESGTSAASSSPTGAASYPVTYTENGLPVGTPWSVTLANATARSLSPAPISFSEPDGEYAYSIPPVTGFSPEPATGSVTVNGSPLSFHVPFASPGRPIEHVVVIVLEDQSIASVVQQSPYLRYLSNTYGNVSDFYAECHGSLPNYAAMTSGRYFACGANAIRDSSAENLPDLLERAGDSWAGYFEGMDTPCQTYGQGSYQTDHNPFLVYTDVAWNQSRCDAHVVNSAAFNESLRQGVLPTVSFYVPDRYDDCRHSSLAYCTGWIRTFLPAILNSSAPAVQSLVAHTAFFVVFDEGADDTGYAVASATNPWCQQQTGTALAACGGHTYLTVVSPYSVGTSYASPTTDYSVLSTIEWLFGLGSDGGYDGTTEFPSFSPIFTFPSNT